MKNINVSFVDGFTMKQKVGHKTALRGTKWEDIPDDWTCPDCGVSKADFEMIEI